MTRPNHNGWPLKTAPIITIAVIMIATAVSNAFTPWAGDDLVYGPGYSQYYSGSLLYYPRWVIRHWLMSNGRAANYLACLLMHFSPRWLVITLNTLVVGAFYSLIAYWCSAWHTASSRSSNLTESTIGMCQMLVIAIVALAYPWWDSSWLIDVSLNYVWSTAIGLAWATLFFTPCRDNGRLRLTLLTLLSLLAGCMHEALGAPLLAGILVWLWASGSYRKLSRNQRFMIGAFAVGVAAVLFAPGIWRRFGDSARVADDPLIPLLAKSDWMVMLMLAAFGVAFCFRRSRRHLASLCRTSWVIWPLAAIGSMCFSAAGGIVGRSGWFATTFALIALAQWLFPLVAAGRQTARLVASVLAVAVALQVADTARWQIRTGSEMRHILNAYSQAPEQIVFANYTHIDQLPAHLLNKLRLTPDPDNFYELWTIRTILGDSIHPLLVLPPDAASLLAPIYTTKPFPEGIPGRCSFGEITANLPTMVNDSLGIAIDTITGLQLIVQPLPHRFITDTDTLPLYYITPRLLNPGDR